MTLRLAVLLLALAAVARAQTSYSEADPPPAVDEPSAEEGREQRPAAPRPSSGPNVNFIPVRPLGGGNRTTTPAPAGAPAAATALVPLPWGNVLQHQLEFLVEGQGYTVRWKAKSEGSGQWSWVFGSWSRPGCQYRAVVTTDPMMKKPVAGCEATANQGNIRVAIKPKAEACSVKAGESYYLHFYASRIPPNTQSMIDVGKTTCKAWLAHNGGFAEPY